MTDNGASAKADRVLSATPTEPVVSAHSGDAPLRDCPFCGGSAELQFDSGNEVWGKSWQVRCTNCGVATGKAWGSNSWQRPSREKAAKDAFAKREAVNAWNQRPDRNPKGENGEAG